MLTQLLHELYNFINKEYASSNPIRRDSTHFEAIARQPIDDKTALEAHVKDLEEQLTTSKARLASAGVFTEFVEPDPTSSMRNTEIADKS